MTKELNELVKENKHIFRDCNIENLSKKMIVQRFISLGDMDEIKQLVKILGKENISEIFKSLITSTDRVDLSPRLINFFVLLFDLEDEIPLSDIISRAKENTYFHR